MSDPYPTPTRLALLRDVAAGEVCCYRNGESYLGTGDRRVTARMAELRAAGWVELAVLTHTRADDVTYQQWRLTDAGRAMLDGARCAP